MPQRIKVILYSSASKMIQCTINMVESSSLTSLIHFVEKRPCYNLYALFVLQSRMDVQLPMESVFITTNVVSSNPHHVRCTR